MQRGVGYWMIGGWAAFLSTSLTLFLLPKRSAQPLIERDIMYDNSMYC